MRYAYPAILEPDDDGSGGFTVTFDGINGVTWGHDREDALGHARDALISMLSVYVEEGNHTPPPGKANGRPMVSVTILESAKLALHDAMVAGRISNVELARRLGVTESIGRRLRDPLHASKIDLVEKALRAVGCRARVEFEMAA